MKRTCLQKSKNTNENWACEFHTTDKKQLFTYEIKGRLYVNDFENGLMELVNGKLDKLPGCETLAGDEINAIIPLVGSDNLLIGSSNKGMFVYSDRKLHEWKVPVNDYLKKNQIYSAILLKSKNYVFGTVQDGIIISDFHGNILQHINRNRGLQNNTVLNLLEDHSGDLWLGLDNGIDFININSPITFLRESEEIGAGYVSVIFNGRFYVGTNQGLFVKDWSENDQHQSLQMIPHTSGQVWYLGIHDGELICGHNKGTFVIDGERATQISTIAGGWKYLTLKRFPGYLIGGTYNGLILFKKINDRWQFVNRISGFNESCRLFEEDDEGNLWMSHGFKGIYKITPGALPEHIKSFRYYTTSDGLPTNFNLNVFKIRNQIVFTSIQGIYVYDKKNDSFEKSIFFNQLLKPVTDFTYLKEDRTGNIWYAAWTDGVKSAGVFRIREDGSLQQITSPFSLLNGKFINGFESIYPFSPDHVFIAFENGFAHYSPLTRYNANVQYSAFITKVIALHLDSTFYYGNHFLPGSSTLNPKYRFRFPRNAFRFYYTSPVYENVDGVEYSFKLSGLNEDWSPWSRSSSVEFALLPDGDYVFSVKARNAYGVESESDHVAFSINPPWYRSRLALLSYFVFIVLFVYVTVRIIAGRIEISKRRERLEHLKAYRKKENEYIEQVAYSEKKIVQLQNDQLKIEMIHRNKELANQTMDLIRKNKFLAKIIEELEKIKNSVSDQLVRDKIVSLIGKIDKDVDQKKQREVFEKAFDEVHEEFLARLKSKYPDLTPNELRLCAYLRMNISTKEIAPLMNISVRGVEICRYRVRKKLNIDRDTNLTSMIIDL